VKRCSHNAGRTIVATPAPANNQTVQAPVVTPQAPPQAAQQNIITIEPMSLDPQMKPVKGRMVIDVYNLEQCTISDTVPHTPVFHDDNWTDVSSQDFKLSRISSSTVWSECTFIRLQFYVYITEPGPHIWALKTDVFEKSWLRINETVVTTNEPKTTGTVIMKPGWYLVDIRLNKNDHLKYYPHYSYQILVKRPSDREMVQLSKDDIYLMQGAKK